MSEEEVEKKEGEESAEDKAENKLTQMRGEIEQLQQEVRILEGMLKNRKPEVVGEIKSENEALEKHKNELEVIFFAAVNEMLKSHTTDEHKMKVEHLKKSALSYFKKAGIDNTIWKNLES